MSTDIANRASDASTRESIDRVTARGVGSSIHVTRNAVDVCDTPGLASCRARMRIHSFRLLTMNDQPIAQRHSRCRTQPVRRVAWALALCGGECLGAPDDRILEITDAEISGTHFALLLGYGEEQNKPGARQKIRRQLFIRRQGPAEQSASSGRRGTGREQLSSSRFRPGRWHEPPTRD
jgi:hypothetical protein